MIILNNARIHTLDKTRPIATGLVIYNDRILRVTDGPAPISQYADFPVEISHIDLDGKFILPGLIDAHLHMKQYSLGLQKVDCETSTKEQCLQNIREHVRNIPAGKWILGHGWNQNEWVDGYGSVQDLDQITDQHPIYLTAKSLHAGWANTAALRRAGIDETRTDPPDGIIQRDRNEVPTGILFEGAMRLVADEVDKPTHSEIVLAIDHAQQRLWRMGVTGVHDFDRGDSFMALQSLHQQGRLHLRVLKSIPREDLEHAIAIGLRSGFGDAMLRVGSLKLFADGALGPRTAAMFDPYQDEPDNRGMLLIDGEELVEIGQRAVANGISLAVHAIGDRANHEVLDAFSQLRKLERDIDIHKGLRHRVEHVQILYPDDFSRLANLDIIASMQPIHATSDMDMADKYWGERAANSYAWKSLQVGGARLVFGSDAPVESPNPFWGIHAAVTRQRRKFVKSGAWYGQQRVQVEDAIRAYTSDAAYAAGMESELGVLKQDYLADLIVLEQDPFSVDSEALWKIEPIATMVGGRWVYGEEKLD